MNLKIKKAENGWIITEEFLNRVERIQHVFLDLKSLGEWIVKRAEEGCK